MQTFKSAPSEDLSLKFFLYLLETLVTHEFQHSTKTILQGLLQTQNFVKAVAVLAVEIYGFINEDSRIDLTLLLDFFRLPAVDLWKVLFSACRGHLGKKTTPTVLLVHLYEIEVNILMKLAWKKDSPLFESLQQSKDLLAEDAANDAEEQRDSIFEEYNSETSEQMVAVQEEVAATSS